MTIAMPFSQVMMFTHKTNRFGLVVIIFTRFVLLSGKYFLCTCLSALEVADKSCDNLDVPRNLHKFGGVEVFLSLLEHPNLDIACKGAGLFALMLQNNPALQEATGKTDALDKIYKFADRSEDCFFRAIGLGAALLTEHTN